MADLTPLAAGAREEAGWWRAQSRLAESNVTSDIEAGVADLLDKIADALTAAENRVSELRDALRESDRVLGRIIAPCPQCHTLGDNPACTTVWHALPTEAREDIRAARNRNSAALAGDGAAPPPNTLRTAVLDVLDRIGHDRAHGRDSHVPTIEDLLRKAAAGDGVDAPAPPAPVVAGTNSTPVSTYVPPDGGPIDPSHIVDPGASPAPSEVAE